jgi:hypothetical protein
MQLGARAYDHYIAYGPDAPQVCACESRLRHWPAHARPLQNRCFQFRGEHGGNLSPMAAVESRDALLNKSFAPARHRTLATVDALGHFIPPMTLGQPQNQPSPSGILRPIGPANWLAAPVS